MRTRLIAALLLLLSPLVLIGCGSSNSTPQNGSNAFNAGHGNPGPGGGNPGPVPGPSPRGGLPPGGEGGGGCGSGIADFYVATNGNDNWSGTLDAPNSDNSDGPFATLDHARRAVQGEPGGKHTVMVRGGNYFLSAPIVFNASDSGSATSPIIYENYPCETPVISGGTLITGWKNSSGNVWTAQLSSGSYQNFETLFYNGERRYRPRTTVGSYLYNAGPVYQSTESDNCGIQTGGQWECFDRFYFSGNDVATSYHSLALGDVEVLDFEKWTMSRMRLQSVDAVNRIAYLTGPTFEWVDNGFFTGHRFLIENVKEALNQPGQWYVDRCTNPPACTSSNGTWTLTYLAQAGETPATAEIIVPQQSQLMIAYNLQYVTFSGLTFAHDNWLPPATGLGDQQGMPKVTAALSFNTSSSITFDSCTIAHTQGWGVEFVGTGPINSKPSNQVVNSALYDLGAGGIRIGAWPNGKDTDATVAQYVLAQNNVVAGGGRVQPTGIGTGIWVGNSHHNTITHNDVHDFYSGAISVGFTYGISNGVGLAHDNMVSYNLVYNLGQGVTSDMGGIYFASSATTGNQALNNVIHDVVHNWQDSDGYGGHGLYFDQGTSNVVARNNLVYRTSSASFFNNLSDATSDTYPQNNLVDNNIFALGDPHTIQRGGNNPSSFTFTHNIAYFDLGKPQGGNWSCYDVGGGGQPVPCTTRFLLDNNLYWNTVGKSPMFITTDPKNHQPTDYTMSEWQALGEDVHSKNLDPLFANPNGDDYSLLPGSPALSLGFVPFDSSQAGRTTSTLTAPTVPEAFPLQLMDPTNF